MVAIFCFFYIVNDGKKDLRMLILDMSRQIEGVVERFYLFVYSCKSAIRELCDISDYSRSAVFVTLSAFYRMSVGSF